jgi:hypothetical protein
VTVFHHTIHRMVHSYLLNQEPAVRGYLLLQEPAVRGYLLLQEPTSVRGYLPVQEPASRARMAVTSAGITWFRSPITA